MQEEVMGQRGFQSQHLIPAFGVFSLLEDVIAHSQSEGARNHVGVALVQHGPLAGGPVDNQVVGEMRLEPFADGPFHRLSGCLFIRRAGEPNSWLLSR